MNKLSASLKYVLLISLMHASLAVAQDADDLVISVDPSIVMGRIADDFIGLGYETSAVAQSDFFAPGNVKMLHLYDTLCPHGLIRIGGNVSDHTQYIADGTAVVHSQKQVTVINRKCLNDLGAFAKASGWHVMWGLNLGTGTKEQAVGEALDVAACLGDRLQSFQIGNEVDFLPRFKRKYDAYHEAYSDYKSAIRVALPKAVFSGPDVANNFDYCTQFITAESTDLQFITHHYYVGDANDNSTSIEKMLHHDDRWETRLKKLRQLSQDNHVPYRINETNSFSGGGKAGVSDTFASALWCLDYMFQLATFGCGGVNIETDINHLAWISHYSPIVHDASGNCFPRPEYYGMMAFAMAGRGTLLKTTVSQTSANVTAYSTQDPQGTIWLTVINKDLDRDLTINLPIDNLPPLIEVFRLTAPTAQSIDKVTFAGAEVASDGSWSAKPLEKLKASNHSATFKLLRASAAIVSLKHQSGKMH